ncbi:MAG: hypothetical protein JWO78_380 [Micavibrio sp.]|nr:hypothetical protein [Micavibrio sp.]
MADLLAKGRDQDLATEMTQDEAAELQFLDHLIGTLPIGNDKEVAEVHILNIVLCDIFTDIAGCVETDDDEIVKSVPTAMATGDTALFLEKYEMKALAYYVRKAIP